MYQALYRKYRPQTFDAVIGQNHITQTLINQVKTGNVSHAYLFTGSRGIGKTTCAKIFAKAMNCLNPQNGSPCGECEVCQALSQPNSTDIVEMDAASNNRVDEIRDLREKVKYPPIVAKKKVYIIDEVHMLTDSAFNALLKTLEEPPAHVVFILATTEIHKLPATILSRCTRFDFRLVELDDLKQFLTGIFSQAGITCDEDSLLAICKAGEGSVRDTLSIADSVSAYCSQHITYDKTVDVLGLSSIEIVHNIINAMLDGDIKGLFDAIKHSLDQSKNISVLTKELCENLKNIILIKSGVTDPKTLNLMPSDVEKISPLASKADMAMLSTMFEKLSAVELDLKFSLNPRIMLESTCLACMTEKKTNFVASAPKSESASAQPVTGTLATPKAQNTTQPVDAPRPADTPAQPIDTSKSTDVPIQSVADTSNSAPVTMTKSASASVQPVVGAPSTNVDRLWGYVLLGTKERGLFALYTSLDAVDSVKLVGDTIELVTHDKSSYDIIADPDRKNIILDIARGVDSAVANINITYDDSIKSTDEIINKLRNEFGDLLKIKK